MAFPKLKNPTTTPTGGRSYNTPPPTSTTAASTDRQKIGVSNEYQAPPGTGFERLMQTAHGIAGTTAPQTRFSLYYDRDEFDIPGGLSAERRADLQLQLRSLGLIDPSKKLHLGRWDDTSAAAFKDVLREANMRGVTWDMALDQLIAEGGTLGSVGGDEGGALPSVSHPDDIARGVRNIAREVYGTGNVPQDKVAGITSSVQGEELRAQGEGSTVNAEDADGMIEDELRKADPMRADARKVVMGLREVGKMLGGGG